MPKQHLESFTKQSVCQLSLSLRHSQGNNSKLKVFFYIM